VAGDDPYWLARIRKQPCAMCGHGPPCDAHHATFGRGMGQRASDRETMPLCRVCHLNFHAGKGPFEGWDQEKRRSWQAEQIRLRTPMSDAF
jgi:hypothetical protein